MRHDAKFMVPKDHPKAYLICGVKCLMFRCPPDFMDAHDTFSLYRCDTGEFLAHADTKEEAETDAAWELMDADRFPNR